MEEIELLIKTFNAELEVFYTGKNEKHISKNSVESLLLDHWLLNLKPQFYFAENEDVLKGVTSLAKKHETDLLIIIPKKHGLFHKSESRDFIFYSSVPVMAIHANDLVEHVY